MTVRRFVVSATTDGSGNATVYTPYFSGKVHSIRYVKTDFTNGVDFTITADVTGDTVWTESNVDASATRYPRAATHSVAGAASLYAAAGEAVNGRVLLGSDRIKIVIASGGATHTGVFHVTVDG